MTHPNPDMLRQGYTFLGVHDRVPGEGITIELVLQPDGSYAQAPLDEEQRRLAPGALACEFYDHFGQQYEDVLLERIAEKETPPRFAVYGRQSKVVIGDPGQVGADRRAYQFRDNSPNGFSTIIEGLYTDLRRAMQEKTNKPTH